MDERFKSPHSFDHLNFRSIDYTNDPLTEQADALLREWNFELDTSYEPDYDTISTDDLSGHNNYCLHTQDQLVAICSSYGPDPRKQMVLISNLYVSKTYRREGVGSYLLTKVEQQARVLGARSLILSAEPSAGDIYRKLNFIPHLANPLIMLKRLVD